MNKENNMNENISYDIENEDPLAPARGIKNAILLSIPLWIIIGLVIYGIVKLFTH
jgi:hypothetical protein